jgi:hypothetical protein
MEKIENKQSRARKKGRMVAQAITKYRKVAPWRYWIPKKRFAEIKRQERESLKVYKLPVS